jgi:hypothetical protein
MVPLLKAHATTTPAQNNPMAGGPRGRAKFDVQAFPKPKPQNPNKL